MNQSELGAPGALKSDSSPTSKGGAEGRYLAALAQGCFLIQRCADCARHVFYPRELCPHCGGRKLAWVKPAGTGTVHSTTVVRRKPQAGGDYNVALVDLDEGVRLMSRVERIAPSDVQIGMRVSARIVNDAGTPLVVFDPV